MNVPANPPIERSEVTVKGETMSAISGACVSSAVSNYNRVSERIRQNLLTHHNKTREVFTVGDHHLLCGQSDI